MINADQHVHTNISHDGISSMTDYISVAKSKDITEITFTEHYDVYKGLKTNLKTLDVDIYKNEYLKLKSDLQINFGIEIGLQPDIYSQIYTLINKYDFDFIIGSSHITTKKDIAKDKSFFENLSQQETYLKYFREVLENIKLYKNEYDVYGHIDYICRYGPYLERKINYKEFNDILDEILINLIKNVKGLEVNTSGYRYVGNIHPNIEILKRYKELGGKIITIGSDAHKAADLGYNFDKVKEILLTIGFNEIAIYHNRIPEFIKIKTL